MFASLTPMRFAGGRTHTVRRKRHWGMQRLYSPDGREMLYILAFYLPRYLDLPFREKLTTVLHELWHIGPKFDGDLRRLGARCYAHGSSQKQYDAHVAALSDRWLSLNPPEDALRLPPVDVFRDGCPPRPRLRPPRAHAETRAVGVGERGEGRGERVRRGMANEMRNRKRQATFFPYAYCLLPTP